MKPTKEQIEAALSLIENALLTADQITQLFDYAEKKNTDYCHLESDDRTISAHILAAAYREQQREIEEVRSTLDQANEQTKRAWDELADAKQQRDTLQDALRLLMDEHDDFAATYNQVKETDVYGSDSEAMEKAKQALATLKGESNE